MGMALQTKNFSEQFADQKLSHAESMALQTKNFSEQFADQKLSHAKFAENIVKQISEGQERTEASQERFSNELFDVRQDVAKNGIFARSGPPLDTRARSGPPLHKRTQFWALFCKAHSLRLA